MKDNKIGICCFSAKHATLRSKNKDWMTRNQDHVSEWSSRCVGRVYSGHHYHHLVKM